MTKEELLSLSRKQFYKLQKESITMYRLVFRNDRDKTYNLLAEGSLEKLSRIRAMSGDIVINPDNTVNTEDCWLFSWEKNDPNCYARRHQTASKPIAEGGKPFVVGNPLRPAKLPYEKDNTWSGSRIYKRYSR